MKITSLETITEEINLTPGSVKVYHDALLNRSTYYLVCDAEHLLCIRGVTNGLGEHIYMAGNQCAFGLLARELKNATDATPEEFVAVLEATSAYLRKKVGLAEKENSTD